MFPPELGLRIRSCLPLSPLGRDSSFRVELEGGSTVKVRRLARSEQAERAFQLLQRLGLEGFPRPLARHGRYLVEPWIEGEQVEAVLPAARMLAELHAAEPGPETSTLEQREAALGQLEALGRSGALTAAQVQRLQQALENTDPRTARTGIVHLDFCAENLVTDSQDRLWSIDNEWLDTGSLDYDLARTLYRWPAARTTFLKAYGSPPPSPFWTIAAVVKSASVRIGFGLGRSDVPLAELRKLARGV